MTDTASDLDLLRAELDRLRAENAVLREASAPPAPPAAAPKPRPARRRDWWRAVVSAVCIVLAGIIVPVAVVGTWTRVQLVSEDSFVATFAPLAEDPDVQQLVIDQASAAVNESVDVAGITNSLFDGIQTLDMPQAAKTALNLLRQPAIAGVQSLVDSTITRIVQSDTFPAVWQKALIASHRALVATATGNEGGAITVSGSGEIGIQLGPIIDELKTQLEDRGFGFVSAVPTVNRTIVVAQADALVIVGTVYNLAVTVGWWMPVIALVLFALGILVARRRTTAVLGTGVAIALGSATLAIALTGAATVLGLSAGKLGIPARTLQGIYFTVVGSMRDTAVVFLFLGVVIALAAWLAGRWTAARRVRAMSTSLSTGARGALQERGLDTGAFGLWLHRQRVLVRIVILVLTLLLLFALRPLSIGDIVLTVVLGLVVWLLAVLLEKAPGDSPAELVVEETRIEEEPIEDDVVVVAAVSADADTEVIPRDDAPAPAATPRPKKPRG